MDLTSAAMPQAPFSTMRQVSDDYRPNPDTYDEMMTADGEIRPHWQPFLSWLQNLPPDELERRWGRVERILFENGLTFSPTIEPQRTERAWSLDAIPLILPQQEWRGLEAGLIQRARLLNALLADLYGPQRLLLDGTLPAPLVYGNPQFLRPCHNVEARNGIFLNYFAADLGRSPDGRWWVLNDRCQAPEGGGFALENRIAMTHGFQEQFRDNNVQRLAAFFLAMRDGHMSLVAHDNPRVVVLSPGPSRPNYMAHSYLSRYLGYTLAEGADLTLRDNRVYLKTLDGLKLVEVLLRWVASDACDPLELRNDSPFGVPGLVHAARAGNVACANALGSGLVESEALMAFLPTLCQRLLGEDLLLPPIATWWCGQKEAQDYVLDNLDGLYVKRAFERRSVRQPTSPAPTVNDGVDRDTFMERIRDRGFDYVAKEPMTLSTTPSWIDGRLQPAPVILRTFVVHTGDGYAVMPGGLARISSTSDSRDTALQYGGGSKDTWIVSEEPVPQSTAAQRARLGVVELRRTGKDLPSRAADNLFWLGRYAERAEDTMRVLHSIMARLIEDARPLDDLPAMQRVLRPLAEKAELTESGGKPGKTVIKGDIRTVLARLMYDKEPSFGLVDTLGNLQRTATLARDRLSVSAWWNLRRLAVDQFPPPQPTLSDKFEGIDLANSIDALGEGLRTLSAFSGLEMENMTRSHGWRFLDMGRRIERGFHIVETLQGLLGGGDAEEDGSLVFLLELADSIMTYRARYAATPFLTPVLDLLLLDETNPRSVAFQVAALAEHIDQLPRDHSHPIRGPDQRVVMAVLTDLRLSDAITLSEKTRRKHRKQLEDLLDRVSNALGALSEILTRTYFSHAEEAREAVTGHRIGSPI